MKSRIIIALLAAVAGMLLMAYCQKETRTAHLMRIAFFMPTTHPALEEIEQGFKETLRTLSPKSCDIITYNANGNRTLLRAQAEEIAQGSYDLICTLGAQCSQTMAGLLHKRGMHTPHIFCAVDSKKFAESLVEANASTTGVYVQLDYKKGIDALRAIKPNIKNVLLVYDPTHGAGLEDRQHEIAAHTKQYGIMLHSVEVYHSNEIQQKVAALLPSVDVALVLVDNTVVSGIDALIALCNRYGVTLFASDLASGKKGAALAYGITEYESGSGAAHMAHEIIDEAKKPQDLPMTALSNFRLAINNETKDAQRVCLEGSCVQ